MNVLEEILIKKRKDVKRMRSIDTNKGFYKRKTYSLKEQLIQEFTTIFEFKRKTPSSGDLGNPPIIKQVQKYITKGAKVISVLTDQKYFGGSYQDLAIVREKYPSLLLLNKEFVVSKIQIDYAKFYGADVVLLIAKALSEEELIELYQYAEKLSLDVIVEIHDEKDVKKISNLKPQIVGINNRNLDDFSVDISVTKELAKKLNFNTHIISESGIHTLSDFNTVRTSSSGALIGTAFMNGNLLNAI